jgi:hypothetical protein
MKTKNTKYNLFLLSLISIVLCANPSHAGEKGGNGGVVFQCTNKIQLVDAWEAEDTGFSLKIDERVTPGMDEFQALRAMGEEYLERVKFFETERYTDYSTMWADLLSDLQLLQKDPKSKFTKYIRFTDGVLPLSLDSDEITQRRNCDKKQAITQKEPSMPGERLLTIDSVIWEMMDTPTRALILFHEINVSHSVANGFTETTAPARALNRYFASPDISSTKTQCDYLNFLRNQKMNYQTNDGYDQRLDYFKIDELTLPINSVTATCWDSTRRFKNVRANAYLTFENITSPQGVKESIDLRITDLQFMETSSVWTSGGVINGIDSIQITPGKSGYSLNGGKILKNSDGSYHIDHMTQQREKPGRREKDIGSADVDFSSLKDGMMTVNFQ